MPGKASLNKRMIDFFGKKTTPWGIFREKFQGINSAEAAVQHMLKITDGKILTSIPSIVKIVEEGLKAKKATSKDAFTIWVTCKTEGQANGEAPKHRGKATFKETAEKHFGINLWEIFRDKFKDVQTAESAVKRMLALTGGMVVTSAVTIAKTIERGLEAKEITDEDFFAAWKDCKSEGQEKGQVKRRGKAPLREKLENFFKNDEIYGGKNIWDIFREVFKGVKNVKDAPEILKKETGGKISTTVVTLISTIEKGLEANEITDQEFFVAWTVKDTKRAERKAEKALEQEKKAEEKAAKQAAKALEDGTVSNLPAFAITERCTCGTVKKTATQVLNGELTMGFPGKKCGGCGTWGSAGKMTITGTYLGIPIRKKVIFSKQYDMMIECYVDEHDNEIENPLRKQVAA